MISRPEEYDHLFQNLIPNSIEGIKIFGVNDSYVKPQNYDSVTNLENRILERARQLKTVQADN